MPPSAGLPCEKLLRMLLLHFPEQLRPTTAEGHTAVWTRARAANPLQSGSTKGEKHYYSSPFS